MNLWPPQKLYSSALYLVVVALTSWLSVYNENPSQANVAELMAIQAQLRDLSVTSSSPNYTDSAIQTSSYADNMTNEMTIMGWWYPGAPACNALLEAGLYNIDVAKPEYFIVQEGGRLEFMTEELYGCNGFSESNVNQVRSVAPEQFVTISSSYARDMAAFLQYDASTNEHADRLVRFVVMHNLTGIELDFEDYGGWTESDYQLYKSFVYKLGNRLHAEGKQLMLDFPAVRNNTEEMWYRFRLSDFDSLPVDYMVIMAYDYQYDHGAGSPVAPLDWLAEVVDFTKNRIADDSKIVIGLPTYGYIAETANGRIRAVTREQAAKDSLYSQAVRDANSKELIAQKAGKTLVFQDEVSLQAKYDVVLARGVRSISLWHLGGNPYLRQ